MTQDSRITCSLCAWRGTCAKKFSISTSDLLHCIDYTRDLTIKGKKKDPVIVVDGEKENKEKEGKNK